MLPVDENCPVAGLNSSAVATQLPLMAGAPPATSPSPFGSTVALSHPRAVDILPVTLHLPFAGLKSSALARDSPVLVSAVPPATRTSPVFSNVEVWLARAVFMLPVNGRGLAESQLPKAVPCRI